MTLQTRSIKSLQLVLKKRWLKDYINIFPEIPKAFKSDSTRTSPFKPNEPFYSNGLTVALPSPTDDTRALVSVALWALNRLYRAGYNYQKAGVMLSDLVPAEGCQTDLFASQTAPIKSNKLMTVMDNINKKMGKESIKVASEGFKRHWKMRQENKSPCYTTKWDELLVTK